MPPAVIMESVLTLMELPISAPDHTTVSRRGGGTDAQEVGAESVPKGPLHVLIDSTGLEVFGALTPSVASARPLD